MAFVRCWAEGLDMAASWNRYMFVDGAADARRARGELQRLLDELRSLARAHGRPEVAALLRRDPEAILEQGSKKPTLEEFRNRQPPDFYTEAELIELYQAEFGARDSRSPARRKQRLRERLVLAVQWLESVGAREPRPEDPISAWLDERVAARLAGVGIQRLSELTFWIRTKGFHWHRGIPRIGPEGAARIVRWLRRTRVQPGRPALPCAGADEPDRHGRADPGTRIGIVPLERFMPAVRRDGSKGSTARQLEPMQGGSRATTTKRFRPGCACAFRAPTPGAPTARKAERFLLWAVMERRKALSSLDGDDCVAYRDFLAAPGPEWTGPRNAQRWSEPGDHLKGP
jgi:hypothetical protein